MKFTCRLLAGVVERAAVSDQPPAARTWLAAHLERCETCRSRFGAHRRTLRSLDAALDAPQTSDAFMTGVWQRVTARQPAAVASFRPDGIPAGAMAFGAAALLLVVLGIG